MASPPKSFRSRASRCRAASELPTRSPREAGDKDVLSPCLPRFLVGSISTAFSSHANAQGENTSSRELGTSIVVPLSRDQLSSRRFPPTCKCIASSSSPSQKGKQLLESAANATWLNFRLARGRNNVSVIPIIAISTSSNCYSLHTLVLPQASDRRIAWVAYGVA